MHRPDKTTRSPYGLVKRARRGVLRRLGQWSRRDYDIRIVHADGQPVSKQIRFSSAAEADRVSASLRRFDSCPFLPQWQGQTGAEVEVEFVVGTLCNPVTTQLLPELAACLGHFHRIDVRHVDVADSPILKRHTQGIDTLHRAGVIDRAIADALRDYTQHVAPRQIAVGFDYTDPIERNLVQRADNGRCCAIDVKNLRAGQPLGLGMAKMSNRWLTPERQPVFFENLPADACSDYRHYFDFLRVLEGVQRAVRKTKKEARFARIVTKTRARRASLVALMSEPYQPAG